MVWGQILTFFVMVLLMWFWKNRKLIAFSWRTDGPFALLPLGSIFHYRLFLKPEAALNNLMVISKEYKKKFKFWMGPFFIVVLKDPEEIKCFFASKLTGTKSFIFKNWAELMGEGLITASGQLWKRHRRIANPFLLGGQLLKTYHNSYVTHSRILVQSLEEFCDIEPVDLILYTSRCTGDILAETIFKVKPHFYLGTKDKYLHAVENMAEAAFRRMLQIWLYPRVFFRMSECGRKAYSSLTLIQEYAMDIIKETQERNQTVRDESEQGVVDVMLQRLNEGNGIESIEEIRDEVQNIFSAGMDTSATVAAFLVLMMGIYKECQEKLWNEIKEFYADDLNKEVEYGDISRLKYLDWCTKEACRLFPVAFVTLRDVEDDVHIKTDKLDYVIPYGTTVMVSNYALHKDDTVWEDPEEFIPERFSPEASATRPSFAYFPFGGGSRQCIGLKFGIDSMKTMIIYVLRKYEIHSDWKLKDIPIKCDVSVRSSWGYKVKLTRRKH